MNLANFFYRTAPVAPDVSLLIQNYGHYPELITARGFLFGRKSTSICNLLNLLSFLFFSINHVFWHFSRFARHEICSKLAIETPEYVKLTIKLKIKTQLTSLWPFYSYL